MVLHLNTRNNGSVLFKMAACICMIMECVETVDLHSPSRCSAASIQYAPVSVSEHVEGRALSIDKQLGALKWSPHWGGTLLKLKHLMCMFFFPQMVPFSTANRLLQLEITRERKTLSSVCRKNGNINVMLMHLTCHTEGEHGKSDILQ